MTPDWPWLWYRTRRALALSLLFVPPLGFVASGFVCVALDVHPTVVDLAPYALGVVACLFLGRAWLRSLKEQHMWLPVPRQHVRGQS